VKKKPVDVPSPAGAPAMLLEDSDFAESRAMPARSGASSSAATSPAVGGYGIPIDTTALLLANAQSMSLWMLPVIAAGIGIGVLVLKKRN